MVFNNLLKKISIFKKDFLQDKDIAISFAKKTHFLKLKKNTQLFLLFFIFIFSLNVFYVYKENINDVRKNVIFNKNEELVKKNTDLEDKFENIQKQMNLIDKYLEVIDTQNSSFNLKKDKKIKLFNGKNNLDKKVSIAEQKLSNIYSKIIKRYNYTEAKIEKLNLFSYQGRNVFYTKYKNKKDKRKRFDAIGGPYLSHMDSKISKELKKKKIKTLEEVIHRAIENEKFLNLLPFEAPTKANYRISSHFGYRSDPWLNNVAFHNGIDIVAEKDEIVATIDGVVTFASQANGYGNLIEITKTTSDDDKICIRFGHIRKMFVKNGDFVKKGQIIALQGSKGRSTAKHIHYEAKYNDVYLNPKNLIDKNI